ncbi:MAG: hypothetical protein QM731_18275 [Chitinophagaceae bacterium]
MRNKSIARLLLITAVLVVTGSMLAIASAQAVKNAREIRKECAGEALGCCDKTQGEFTIWEILSRTVFTSIQ